MLAAVPVADCPRRREKKRHLSLREMSLYERGEAACGFPAHEEGSGAAWKDTDAHRKELSKKGSATSGVASVTTPPGPGLVRAETFIGTVKREKEDDPA